MHGAGGGRGGCPDDIKPNAAGEGEACVECRLGADTIGCVGIELPSGTRDSDGFAATAGVAAVAGMAGVAAAAALAAVAAAAATCNGSC